MLVAASLVAPALAPPRAPLRSAARRAGARQPAARAALTRRPKNVRLHGLQHRQAARRVLEEEEIDALLNPRVPDGRRSTGAARGVPKTAAIMQERAAARAEEAAKEGLVFLGKAAKEEGAVQTDSGLVVKDLVVGDGKSPTAADTVKVHYGARWSTAPS